MAKTTSTAMPRAPSAPSWHQRAPADPPNGRPRSTNLAVTRPWSNLQHVENSLLVLGLVLFLVGLLAGLVAPRTRNPRMGLASHLQGMTNGPFLMVIGLMWPRVHLPHVVGVAVVVMLAYSTYANWLATQLAAIWGAGRRFAPIAAGDHHAGRARERVVDGLLVTLTPAIIIACVALVAGLLR